MTPRVEYRDLLGIPYVFLGRDASGASCMWIPLELHRRAGHMAIDPLEDPISASQQWEAVDSGPWEYLDILWIDTKETGITGHAGCLVETDPPFVLHATRDRGTILTALEKIERKVLFGSRWIEQPIL